MLLSAVGTLLIVAGLIMLAPGILASYNTINGIYDESRLITPFLITAITSISLGLLLSVIGRGTELRLFDAAVAASLAWIIIPVIGAIPLIWGAGLSIIDALFEGLSGFTGTGFTMISKPELMPQSILLWRGLMQWTGELGIVVVSAAIFPFFHALLRGIYTVERGAKITPTIIGTSRRMGAIYLVYTLIGIALFMWGGMSFFDAIIHSMTGIATGGMSTKSLSIGYWKSFRLELAVIIIMVLGALNFADHYKLFKRKWKEFFSSVEVRGYIALQLLFIALAAIAYMFSGTPIFQAIREGMFHSISAMSTTGFQIGDLSKASDAVKSVLIMAMIIGGCTFSTAGGLKIKRIVLVLKVLIWETKRMLLPPTVLISRAMEGKRVSAEEMISALSFVVMYLMVLSILTFAVMIHGYGLVDSLFEVTSAMSCVGLSVGLTSVKAPLAVKLILMIAMYLGRLEFLPLYITLGSMLTRRYGVKR